MSKKTEARVQVVEEVAAPRRRLLAALGSVLLAPLTPAARAQGKWPDKNLRIIVPYAAGASTDAMARIIGQKLTERWGQSVLVENKPGAGGNIGAEFVAKSDPDGYTLLLPGTSHAVNGFLYPSVKWDPVKDFKPITLLCTVPNVMVVPADSPFKSVAEFIKFARANPGKLNFGSAGAGTSLHLSAELFKRATGIQMQHVPYRGSAPALNELVAGRLDVMFAVMSSAAPLVKAGQLRALGVTTSNRVASAPTIPTVAESGVPGFDTSAWYAIFAPAKTPDAVADKLNQDIRWALAEHAVHDQFENTLGVQVVGSSRQELADFLAKELTKWGVVIQDAGIRLE